MALSTGNGSNTECLCPICKCQAFCLTTLVVDWIRRDIPWSRDRPNRMVGTSIMAATVGTTQSIKRSARVKIDKQVKQTICNTSSAIRRWMPCHRPPIIKKLKTRCSDGKLMERWCICLPPTGNQLDSEETENKVSTKDSPEETTTWGASSV